MMRNMERMMERMALGNRHNPREHADGPPRNPIRPTMQQIRQREQRNQGNQGNQATQADQANQANQANEGNQGNQGDQQIRPPFQNNYVNEYYDGYFEDNMNCCDDKETKVFLTKEEHDQFMDASEIFLQGEEERVSVEREDYETGLKNAIMQFQRKYNLRNQKIPPNPPKGNPPKGNPTIEAQSNIPSSSQPKKDSSTKYSTAKDSTVKNYAAKDIVEKGKQKEEPQKQLLTRKEISSKEVEKTPSSFDFESEMAKIKISVPFNELIKNNEYINHIINILKTGQTFDTPNIQDDHPPSYLGQE
jgi:hypothetical protein